jgi:hypothetical protein
MRSLSQWLTPVSVRDEVAASRGPMEFTTAWVADPALAVQADGQRYRHLRSSADRHVVSLEAVDGGFAADITVDGNAVVIDYPSIARRLTERLSLRPRREADHRRERGKQQPDGRHARERCP